jgi:hypothetical protein
LSIDEPGLAAPPRRHARGHRAVTALSKRAQRWLAWASWATGPGQQCWASGWKANPILCGDFPLFNFFNILENSYKFQKYIENIILLRKI